MKTLASACLTLAIFACPEVATSASPGLGDDNPFQINQGLSGAWYEPETAGQGLLIDVRPGEPYVFAAWYTYDLASKFGGPSQRWFTAQGPYAGASATLTVHTTSGGYFDASQPVSTAPIGELTIEFTDCATATLVYSLDGGAVIGEIELVRLFSPTASLCDQIVRHEGIEGGFVDANGPEGLRVASLYRSTRDELFVASSGSGRLYRSLDNGDSWSATAFEAEAFNAVLDVFDDGLGTLYLANGCLYSPCGSDAGLYVSADRGETWSALDGFAGSDAGQVFANQSVILVADPIHGNLFRSVNGGGSFDLVLSDSLRVGEILQSADGTILVADTTGAYRSTDDGATWTHPFWFSSLALFGDSYMVMDTAGRLFVSNGNELVRSLDDGLSWQNATGDLPACGPDRPVCVSSLAADDSGGVVMLSETTLFRTDDGGDTWIEIADTLFESGMLDSRRLHAAADGRLLGTDNAGIKRSEDGGLSWLPSDRGITEALVSALHVLPDGRIVADVAGNDRVANGGLDAWQRDRLADHMDVFGQLVAVGPAGQEAFWTDEDQVALLSADASSAAVLDCPPGDLGFVDAVIDGDGELFVGFDDHANETVRIYHPSDDLTTLMPMDTGLPDGSDGSYHRIDALRVAPNGTVFVALHVRQADFSVDDAELYRLSRATGEWSAVPIGAGQRIFDLAFLSQDTVLAGTEAGLLRSTDGGLSFSSANAALPIDGWVRAFAVTPEGGVYAALSGDPQPVSCAFNCVQQDFSTDNRVLFSNDQGQTWTDWSAGLPQPQARNPVQALAVADGYLYAVTPGGGVSRSLEIVADRPFRIRQDVFGAWFDPTNPGQGMLFDVWPGNDTLFAAWFTFEPLDRAKLGSPGQRWLTAQGEFAGTVAGLSLYSSTDGVFDDPQMPSFSMVGWMDVEFFGCHHAAVNYLFLGEGRNGEIPLTRLMPGSGAMCEGGPSDMD